MPTSCTAGLPDRETLHSTAHRILDALHTCLSRAFARRKGQQEEIAIKMQRQSGIHDDICFAKEVAVESSRFRRDFFNSPPRRSENTRPGGTFLPTTNCQPTS